MVLMAVDHARHFLHNGQFNPEDLTQTNPALFFTRWITHFCAPIFIFLVGTSTFLMSEKIGSKKKISRFLISRGLFLILLELLVFRFCWNPTSSVFDPYISMLVIWAIGISMIFLALIIYLPFRIILIFGLSVLILQDLLNNISFPEGSAAGMFWAFFYRGGGGMVFGIYVSFLYPVLTYFGLISLGYCLGSVYRKGFSVFRRKKILTGFGAGAILLFLILRSTNIYGDPRPWEGQQNFIFSLMAFLKTSKYPVSLLFALMTIGPALLALRLIEPVSNKITRFFVTIGSVPMFYYILHLPAFVITGFIIGFNLYDLSAVYLFFAVIVFVLYLLCRSYAKYKFSHPEKKWLKYI
jgi:uncharacterized membrane protein